MEDEHMLDLELEGRGFSESLDLCEELKKRYGDSTAIEHQYLCASATAMRKVVEEQGLALTPLSYFAATISALNDIVLSFSSSSKNSSPPFDTEAISSLTSFLLILIPLIPSESTLSLKANDAVMVLVLLLKIPEVAQSPATIRSVIKSLGFLIKLCDLDDLVLGMILGFSIDKRTELREAAQVWVEQIYKSFQDTNVVNEASDLFYSMFYKYLPNAGAVAWSKIEIMEDSEDADKYTLMECVHMLTVLKIIVLYLSNDVVSEVMSKFHLVMGQKYSLLTRPSFATLEVILESSRVEEIINVPKTEIIIYALGNYVKENNPADTILAACVLLRRCLIKLYADADKRNIWVKNLPLVFEPIARVVGAGLSVSGEAAGILIELINQHIYELKTSIFDASVDKLKELLRVTNGDTIGENFQHLEAAIAVIGH